MGLLITLARSAPDVEAGVLRTRSGKVSLSEPGVSSLAIRRNRAGRAQCSKRGRRGLIPERRRRLSPDPRNNRGGLGCPLSRGGFHARVGARSRLLGARGGG